MMMEIGRKSLVTLKDWNGERKELKCLTRGSSLGGITIIIENEKNKEYFVPIWNVIKIRYLDRENGIERLL